MAKQKVTKVLVSERALFQRLNRRLKQDDEKLMAARSVSVETSVGHHYIVDIRRNAIVHQDVDIESLARKLGVLRDWEALKAD